MNKFTHIDEKGNAKMVDVSLKSESFRVAVAEGIILMNEECFLMVKEGRHKKGDVLTVAQVAAIMGAKKCSSIIPLTHNTNLKSVDVTFEEIDKGYKAIATVKCLDVTGVEMEALTSVSVALLTIYDMCKAIDKRMVIKDIHLVSKSGGKSGDFNF